MILRPFTSAEPGTLGEFLEVCGFVYCFVSLFIAPAVWYAWRGIDDPNRLRRYLKLASVPFVWSMVVVIWSAQAMASYLSLHFRRELRELIPERKPAPVLRSPRDLGLWE